MNPRTIAKDIKANKTIYFMLIPIVLFFFIFNYVPMFGVIMAFQDFRPALGVFRSDWIGLTHFIDFFESHYFLRLLRNTFLLSFYDLIVNFPAAIVFALLLNELRHKLFKKCIQTISYMPFFISMVVISGIILDFFSSTGAVTEIISRLGGPEGNLIGRSELFRSIFVGTNVWQFMGFNSIIYLAALAGIDQELYEAAVIDGANRWKQTLHVTLPGIASTIIIMLILRVGQLMTVNFEKVILLYSPSTYITADVIQSFTFRKGLIDFNFGYSTAVGLFNSLMNFSFLLTANWLAKKHSDTSLF